MLLIQFPIFKGLSCNDCGNPYRMDSIHCLKKSVDNISNHKLEEVKRMIKNELNKRKKENKKTNGIAKQKTL